MPPEFKVLVVEDNDVNLCLMQSILKMVGCTVLGASNAKEALHVAKDEHVDLIFLDIQLPDGDGLEVAQTIRQDLQLNTPIAILTAHAFNEYRTKAAGANCQYFITKPLSISTIESVVKDVKDKVAVLVKGRNENPGNLFSSR